MAKIPFFKRRLTAQALRNKYRLVIMNDDTFEEKASWKLTPMNVFVAVGTFLIVFTFILTYIIAFTPLREYIPGYADVNQQRQIRVLTKQVQNLQETIEANDLLLKNIRSVVDGKVMEGQAYENVQQSVSSRYDSIRSLHVLPRVKEDSLLRMRVAQELQSASMAPSVGKEK